ncbi:MAG TPA: class I SAM-dependent methyltransferase [Mariniflexile sp.]
MKKIIKLLKLYDPRYLNSLSKRISILEKELNKLTKFEKDLDLLIDNPEKLWLDRNKAERMDALINDDEYTHKTRRDFHLDRYKFASEFVKGKIVADIACGTGYGTRILLEKGNAKKCTGIDIDENTVLYSQRKHGINGSEYICASADDLPLENDSIDIIVSFETLEHVIDENLVLNEFFRVLKPKGRLIISTPNKWPLSIMPYHTKEYDLKEFKRVLNTKFKIENVYNQNSGHFWKYNHNQDRGIIQTTDKIKDLAECFIAVCIKTD